MVVILEQRLPINRTQGTIGRNVCLISTALPSLQCTHQRMFFGNYYGLVDEKLIPHHRDNSCPISRVCARSIMGAYGPIDFVAHWWLNSSLRNVMKCHRDCFHYITIRYDFCHYINYVFYLPQNS